MTAGLELVRAVQAGSAPVPGIARLLGFTLDSVEPGQVVAVLATRDDMTNPMGTVHGGVAATLLDTVMGCAVHTTLPAGVGYTTSDLQVRYIRAMGDHTGRVLAEGKVLHSGKRTATAEGRLFVQADGHLIAHGTTGCVVFA